MKCDICGLEIEVEPSGWSKGHNPAPLGKHGDRCCKWCDEHLVYPLRVRMLGFINSSQLAAEFFAARKLHLANILPQKETTQ